MSTDKETQVRDFILQARNEAEEAKRSRMGMNKENYNMYHLNYNFSHKAEGQSKEVLPKQRMAVETTKSTIQQALADVGEWWKAHATDGSSGDGMLITPTEIQKLTNYMLKAADYYDHVGDSVQQALLGSLSVNKVYGKTIPKPKYVTKKQGRGKNYKKTLVKVEDKTFRLSFETIRQENYFPDPTGAGLYEIYDCFLDLHEVKRYADGDYAIYDKGAVDQLSTWGADGDEDHIKARETGQNSTMQTFRPRVKLTRFYGTIIDPTNGDILHENVYVTLANDEVVIQKPTPNPYWHQGSDIVAAPLIKVANSVWHIALMDAATKHNVSMIEIFNLIMDAGMKAVHGVNQLRVDSLEDVSQVSNGIKWGTTLKVNSSLPPGAKVMEPVVTGDIPGEALTVYQMSQQAFNESALTSDLRQGGISPRAVKATEVVEQSNTITSVFQGIAKNIEQKLIQKELDLAWQTTAQNWEYISKEEFVALFGAERGEQLHQLDPEDVFAATVGGIRFEVFGLSLSMAKAGDFRKYTTLLQTVGASEIFMEQFLKEYDPAKFLGEIMVSLDIDKNKIRLDQVTQQMNAAKGGQPQPEQAMGEDPMAAMMGGPDQMSQVPSAGAGSLAALFGAGENQPGPTPGVSGYGDQ